MPETALLTGEQLIGRTPSRAGRETFCAVDPATGEALGPEVAEATAEEIDFAARVAECGFEGYSMREPQRRAAFLRQIARQIEELGDALLERCHRETALPVARLQGERARTLGQLHLFADLVEDGSWVGARIDRADPARQPAPKPDLRRMLVPLGPVAVFGASNFPLAFSVAGGDTVAALAAGCSVVVKAHPSHPGTSEMVGRAILAAVERSGMPDGTFSLLQGRAPEVGQRLVARPSIQAVGFTGSLAAGRALFDAAARRARPIPVYAEMGSSNPVFVLAGALAERRDAIAQALAASVTLGCGQFCTNPGLIVVEDSAAGMAFIEALGRRLAAAPAGTMTGPGIKTAYEAGLEAAAALPGVALAARSAARGPRPETSAQAALLVTDSATFAAERRLHAELYGPATLVVRCSGEEDLVELARGLDGHLTATVHGSDEDLDEHRQLMAVLGRKVGRLIVNGVPTGVEVGHAMHHGGPYPATTDSRSTSVGTAAIERFARPLCFQDVPERLLPLELRDGNPRGIWRMIDGQLTREAR